MIDFSFVIPVYNCVTSLEECVKSITDILIHDAKLQIEIVLVDDGSKDGSDQLCDYIRESANSGIPIRVCHQKNQGVSMARNNGLELSRGRYVIFIDSDDTIQSDNMAILLNRILINEDVDMAVFGMAFDYYLHNKCYRTDEILPPYEGIIAKSIWVNEELNMFSKNVLSSLCNKVIKRNILIDNDIKLKKDMIILEDLEMTLRIMEHCNQVLFFRKALYHYRHVGHDDNAGKRLRKISHINDVLSIVEKSLWTGSETLKNQERKILIALYRNLVSEKIKAVSFREIMSICSDYKSWIDDKGYLYEIESDAYLMKIYKGKAMQLFIKSKLSIIRHSVANFIKFYIGDFRKWI